MPPWGLTLPEPSWTWLIAGFAVAAVIVGSYVAHLWRMHRRVRDELDTSPGDHDAG